MKRRSLAPILGLVWLAFTVIYYYAGHKPFTAQTAGTIATGFWQVACAVAIITIGGALGRLLWPAPGFRPLTSVILQASLGLGLLSIATLLIGTIIGTNSIIGWIALLLSGALLRKRILSWWRDWGDFLRLWHQSSRSGRAIATGVLLILFFTLTTALAPPLKWDALVYHLTIPKLYLSAGRVTYVPGIMFWGMPQASEMLYTWAMALAGNEAGAVFGWMVACLALVGILSYVSEELGPQAGWVSIGALISGFTFAATMAWAYVDWFALLFGWTFLVALHVWRSEKTPRHLAYLGAFAGFALGTKYTAGVLLLAGVPALLWMGRENFRGYRLLSLPIQLGLWSLLLSLPWWLKNAFATGNPFYPFIFPAGAMSSFRLNWYLDSPPSGNWKDLLFLPFRSTFLGLDYGPGYNASIGPLMLGLAVLAWIGWRIWSDDQRNTLASAALLALTGMLIWSVAGRFSGFLLQTRLYFTIFPAIALLSGAGFRVLEHQNPHNVRIGFVASALILFAVFLNVLQIAEFTFKQGAPQLLFGLRSRSDYLADNLGWYEPAMEAIRGLPEDAKVLMIWESRSLYCTPKCSPDEILDRWVRDLDEYRQPEKVLSFWRSSGYTHLLYFRAGDEFLRNEDSHYRLANWSMLDGLLASLPPPQDFGGTYELYDLAR